MTRARLLTFAAGLAAGLAGAAIAQNNSAAAGLQGFNGATVLDGDVAGISTTRPRAQLASDTSRELTPEFCAEVIRQGSTVRLEGAEEKMLFSQCVLNSYQATRTGGSAAALASGATTHDALIADVPWASSVSDIWSAPGRQSLPAQGVSR